MKRILFICTFFMGAFFASLLQSSAWAQATPANIASQPAFWGGLSGILFGFFAAVETLRKYGFLPSKADVQIDHLDSVRKVIAPEGLEFNRTSLGKALNSTSTTENFAREIHHLFYNEHGRLILDKVIQEAIKQEETEKILEKLEESDNTTATQLLKVTNLLTLQNKRLRNVVKALNHLHAQEQNIPNMFDDDDDDDA